jgi:hypothetical protein
MDLTKAKTLNENDGACIRGLAKVGKFEINGNTARFWLKKPNPNGKSNNLILKPWANGLDITKRLSDTWLIDFGNDFSESESSLFEAPYEHLLANVKRDRENQRDEKRKVFWWRLGRSGEELRTAINPLWRYIATPMVAKYRLFVWLKPKIFPDQQLIVIARSDDTTFGILHSRFHELWSLRLGTSLEDRPRYTPTTCFETFPFPQGMTPADTAPKPGANSLMTERTGTDFTTPTPAILVDAERQHLAQVIAEAAFKLNQLRENWLNPSEWVDWVITPEEEKAGFPKRPVAKPGHEANLNKRTLTNLYNAKPAWLVNAHQALDKAVAKAYGWDDYTPEMPDAEILQRLLKLNLAR